MAHWLHRKFLWGFIVLLLIFLAGIVYQNISTQQDSSKPLGKVFKINDYQIHLYCTGSGSPTVILEAGEGGLASSWGWIQPEVTKHTRVCSYERRGLGWSTGDNSAITLEDAAKDLHAVLWAAQLQDKYILVGHGLGGVYIRQYQQRYPEEVVGMVFINAANPAQVITSPEVLSNAQRKANEFRTEGFFSNFGLTRLYYTIAGNYLFHTLPDREAREHLYFWSSPKHYTGMANEYARFEELFAEGKDFENIDPLPVRIVSAADPTPEWERLQNDLFTLSKDSSRITIPDSTQSSLLYDKDHASRVGIIIISLVDTLKSE